MRNYIGVSGPVNISDVCVIISAFENAGDYINSEYAPMIGFLVNKKTLHGIPPKEGKIPHQRYPAVSKLVTMMNYSKGKAINAIHFSPKENEFSEDIIKLFEIDEIYAKGLCRTLQLNTPFPEKKQLEKILKNFPEMEIILQLPRETLSGEKLGEKVKGYSDLIKAVLIDSSGGRGEELDIDLTAKCYEKIREKNSQLIIGGAGGLYGVNVRGVINSFSEGIKSRDFSLDAEGNLRNNDMLCPDRVWHYVSDAYSELSKKLKTL